MSPAPPIAAPIALLQALQERNPTSHLIWIVAAIAAVALGIIVLIGVIDWVRERAWSRRPEVTPSEVEAGDRVVVHEPDTRLRRRFFRRLRPRRRTWTNKEG